MSLPFARLPSKKEVAIPDTVVTPRDGDPRLSEPLYTIREAALYLRVSPNTLEYWVRGRDAHEPIVHGLPKTARNHPELPFVGLTEALVIAAFRRAGASMQYVRNAVAVIKHDVGIEFALASRKLFLHGAQILWNHAAEDVHVRELAEVVTKNRVFDSVVADYLRLITYGSDDIAESLILPLTSKPVVKVDPRFAFGQPLFIRGGARMEDVLERFSAGEDPNELAEDFGVPVQDLYELLRAFIPQEAA